MPLYVRSSAGPRTLHGIDGLASPSNPRDVEILGPYPEEKLLDILDSARMHSARHKTLKTREVIWVCGKRVPVVLRVYVDGKRVFPKGSRGDRLKPRFKALQECLTRSGSACSVPEDKPKEILIKGRKRVLDIDCPPYRPSTPPERYIHPDVADLEVPRNRR